MTSYLLISPLLRLFQPSFGLPPESRTRKMVFKVAYKSQASMALTELSKDKPANKQVEAHVAQFRQTLTSVETELAKQINYLTQVSTGQAHEGSSYNSQKTLQMAMHRLDHAKTRVNELEAIKNKHIQIMQQHQLQKQQGMQQQPQTL
ncbi:Mediator of RNA polymerase II transcription subunit 11 [Portunus trituberculatus]|uniref:Mediator of RNA polymerase II transcription subunit 11 n=1 Tax=Portunus trituberculatus TaxID=210409 RepID=A0A5B7CV43_PORTR|nr:Mediator of RNA polymerase II transcription subunit 11 [Portunus trituberculatus]